MSDLKPWLHDDDVPPEIGRLLRAERNYSPPRTAIDRAVLMIGSAATVTTATTSVLGTLTKAGTSGLGWATKWGAATLLGVGLGTTAAVTARYYSAETVPAVTAAPAKAKTQSPLDRTPSPTVASQEEAPPAEEVSPSATQRHVGGPPAAPVGLAPTSIVIHTDDARLDAPAVIPTSPEALQAPALTPTTTPAPPQSTQEDLLLADEMRYLDRVRGALRQSHPGDALKWLDAYRRNCTTQRMLPEALLLRLRAEVSSGNRSAALATARQIDLQFPKSPHAARARELIAAEHFE